MNNFETLEKRVLAWAEDKGLIGYENAKKQYGKFIEEASELKAEMDRIMYYDFMGNFIRRLDWEDLKMEMGDVVVTLIILARDLDIDILECLDMAYEKISKRTGETIDGVFVKSEDLEAKNE